MLITPVIVQRKDTLDCTYLALSNHCLLSDNAYRLCMALGDNRKSRPVYGGGLSPRRSTTPNLDVSECPGIRPRLALREIWGSDYPSFPVRSAFVASNSLYSVPSSTMGHIFYTFHAKNSIGVGRGVRRILP